MSKSCREMLEDVEDRLLNAEKCQGWVEDDGKNVKDVDAGRKMSNDKKSCRKTGFFPLATFDGGRAPAETALPTI